MERGSRLPVALTFRDPRDSRIFMLAVLAGSVVLLAVTVTAAVCGIDGAVYKPVELIVPICGRMDQVTVRGIIQPTAENCIVELLTTFDSVEFPFASEMAM